MSQSTRCLIPFGGHRITVIEKAFIGKGGNYFVDLRNMVVWGFVIDFDTALLS